MISETIIPTTDELAPLLEEALAGGRTEEEFQRGYLDGILTVLKTDPRQYRSFGPYWWPVKKMLIDDGYSAVFGEQLEQGTLQHYTLERPALTLVAAWAYQQYQFEEGKLRASSHQLDIQDGETYEYELSDTDMELAISGGDIIRKLAN